jgi:MFS family permease
VGFVCAGVGLTALGFGRFAFAVLLPAMRDGLGLSYAEAGIVTGANLLGYLVGCLVAGALAESRGVRAVVSAALALAAAGAGLTALGGSGPAVAGAQLIVGLGAGGAMLPAQNLPVIWFPPRRRGFASGLPSAGIGIGLVVAGTLFPAFLAHELFGLAGWRLAWLTIGGALLAAALGARVWLAGGRGAAPSSLVDALRTRRIWRLSAVYFLFGFSYISYVAFFGAALAAERHWDAAAAGRAWAMGGALSIASGLVWGALSDRLGRRWTIVLVFAVQAASYLTMALAPSDGAVYASVALWGITAWAIPGLASAVATDDVGPRLVHAAMALVTLVGAAGQMSGPMVTGWVADLTRSFVPGLVLAAALALAGSAIAATLRRATPGE